MTDQENPKSPEAIARRKEFLLAQGLLYRSGIVLARGDIRAGLRPATLVRSAISSIAVLALRALKNRTGLDGLRAVIPLLVGGITAVSRKALVKPALGGVLLLGAVGSIARFVIKRKKARKLKRGQNP
jgi:hypothetical protein